MTAFILFWIIGFVGKSNNKANQVHLIHDGKQVLSAKLMFMEQTVIMPAHSQYVLALVSHDLSYCIPK